MNTFLLGFILNSTSDAIHIAGISIDNSFDNITVLGTLNAYNVYDAYLEDNSNRTVFKDMCLRKYFLKNPGSLVYFKGKNRGDIYYQRPINGTGNHFIDLRFAQVGSSCVNGSFSQPAIGIYFNFTVIHQLQPGFWRLANLTFYNLAFNPNNTLLRPYRFNDVCPSTICGSLKSNGVSTFFYNVTTYGNYSVNEK